VIHLENEIIKVAKELRKISEKLINIAETLEKLAERATTEAAIILDERILQLLQRHKVLSLNDIKDKLGLRRLAELKETVRRLSNERKITILGSSKRLTGKTKISLVSYDLRDVLKECYNKIISKKAIKDAGVNIPELWKCVQEKCRVSWDQFEQTILDMSKKGAVELEEGLPGAIKKPEFLIRDRGKVYYYIVFTG